MRYITKKIFLNTLICPRLGWLLRNTDDNLVDENDVGAQFRKEQGIEVGKKARYLFPEGVQIIETNIDYAVKRTEEVIRDENIPVLFEAAFKHGKYVARADILIRENNEWNLIEVKSASKDKSDLIDDLAYTLMITRLAGLNVTKASLYLVSKEYRYGMPVDQLFLEIDHTRDADIRINDFNKYIEPVERFTNHEAVPDEQLIYECKNCYNFSECTGRGIKDHVFELPRISSSKFEELSALGVSSIDKIPDDFSLTKNQKLVQKSVKSNEVIMNNSFKDLITGIIWPAYYLDFETFMTAIPLYPETAPHAQIPTQYSIHKCSDTGNIDKHMEYLADPTRDCRRELALHLIRDLGTKGSIIVYSNFEERIIKGLIQLYPDLECKLAVIIERIVDLLKIINGNFYHPDFHGSYSIKKVLPALVPDMTYENLEIGNGDTASAVYANMAMGKHTAEEMRVIRRNLLTYCAQDTLAMVKLHERLMAYV